jgi:hypothetical protein
MAELFNARFKRIFTGSWLALLFICLYLMFRDTPERIGICTSCCSAAGEKICKPNVTEQMCREYNQRNVDGMRWEFVEKGNGKCP